MRKSKPFKDVRKILSWHSAIGLGLTLILLIFLSACEKVEDIFDPDPIPEPENNSIIDQFTTSSDYEVLELDGYKIEILPGSIPALANGNEATVTFSIETGLDLPKSLPIGITQVGDAVHFGPEGFVFQLPLLIKFPLPDNYTPDQVSIVHFDDEANAWRIVPTGFFDQENNTIGAYVFDLDLYTLVNVEGYNKSDEERFAGGIQWRLSSRVFGEGNCCVQYPPHPDSWNPINTYVILQIASFTPKYDLNYSLWGDLVGKAFMTQAPLGGGSQASSDPFHSRGIEISLPQGEYTFCVKALRERYDAPNYTRWETKTYDIPAYAVIDEPVICNGWPNIGVDQACTGWTLPKLPLEGTWIDSDICEWPEHTVPVCTGEFQATLTWENHNYEATDLDLYLYTPDGSYVFYNNTQIGDILLDRDVREDKIGHAQENICAPFLDDMPKGNYRVAVQHYDGAEKDFQVRLVRGGKSESYSGTIRSGNPEITVFEFTID